MTEEDLRLLKDWYEQNQDHALGFLEKSAIKLAVSKAGTVKELMDMALSLLKK